MDWSLFKNGKIPTREQNDLRVLSIDGGGMKGIIPSVYLKRIEEHIGDSIYKYFDLITGTSTGGIIALGLSIGMSGADILGIYIEEGAKIFSKKIASNMFFSSKYNNAYLKEILQEKFADIKLEGAYTMLCIPSIEHHKAEPKVFKTPHHSEYISDGKRYMWEVALATSAAPMFFPAAEIGEAECKIDGGLWANNPILVALAEGKKLGFELNEIRVLSLGTGDSIYNISNKVAKKSGLIGWGSNIVDLTFQVQSKSATYTASYLLGENLKRIEPIFGRALKLDSTKEEDITFMINEANRLYEKTFIKNKVFEQFFK